jgi:hypothetical protein
MFSQPIFTMWRSRMKTHVEVNEIGLLPAHDALFSGAIKV